MPQRIQRKRTKGWRMPGNAFCVTRPGRFGNPFTTEQLRELGYGGSDEQARLHCVDSFRVWLGPRWWEVWQGEESERRRKVVLDDLHRLRGKDLACFCPLDKPCHADVLLELANRPEATQ